MRKLQGKVAIVTGASKGIGAGIANQLASDGASVVVNYASDQNGTDKVVAEIAKASGNAIAVRASDGDVAGIDTLFAAAKKAFGAVDILVNNAGVYKFAPIESLTAEDIDWISGVNGPTSRIQSIARHLRWSEHPNFKGRVVRDLIKADRCGA